MIIKHIKVCRGPASVTCHVFLTKNSCSEGLFVCLFVMFYPHFLKLCLSWLFVTFDPHFLKRSFCPILNCTHIKWAERRRRKAKPQNVLGTSGYIVHTQTESWPEDPILGLASRRLAFALYDTTDENLARHSCCFLRDKIKEKQGSNLLLSLCVALSPTLRLCAQIKISRRQNRDETPLCAILIEIHK